jgi:hypothetical protein
MPVISHLFTNATLRRFLPVGRDGRLLRSPGFTAAEVRATLAAAPTGARGRAVARCAGDLHAWLPPEPHYIECPYRAWRHLPRIVFWHARGEPLEAIIRLLGLPNGGWDVERALDHACARIADALNRDPAGYGVPVRHRAAEGVRHRDRR